VSGREGIEMDHERWHEAVELGLADEANAAERPALEAHLAACTDCRRTRDEARALDAKLSAARIAVRPGFAREVMAALEPAPWEARTPRVWRLPIALLVALGVASATLFGLGGAELAPVGGAGAALLAIADLFRAALVAGSGLAAASWQGVGSAVGAWLGDSFANWTAALVLTGGVHFLLYRLLRSRRPAAESISKRP
jgi:hypothetical protein